jgi:hypothetical protein
MPMITMRAATIDGLLEAVRRVMKQWNVKDESDAELWFRGVSQAKYSLLPGIYRRANEAYNESDLLVRFKQLAAPRLSYQPENDWEWYFVAQHYGLPTRLLDWTENLFVAMYFALSAGLDDISQKEIVRRDAKPCGEPVYGDESPTIWMMDAGSLNKLVVKHDGPLDYQCECTEMWRPPLLSSIARRCAQRCGQKKKCVNAAPIAVLPLRTTERILAQQGEFTIHGASRQPLEKQKDLQLARILLPVSHKNHLWRQVLLCGFTPVGLFPELESISKTLRVLCRH